MGRLKLSPDRVLDGRNAGIIYYNDFKIGFRIVLSGQGLQARAEGRLPVVGGDDNGKAQPVAHVQESTQHHCLFLKCDKYHKFPASWQP